MYIYCISLGLIYVFKHIYNAQHAPYTSCHYINKWSVFSFFLIERTCYNEQFYRLGDRPVYAFDVELPLESKSEIFTYQLIFDNKVVLFTVSYYDGEVLTQHFNKCQLTDSANIPRGNIHVILDSLQNGEEGQYELKKATNKIEVVNCTFLFLLGMINKSYSSIFLVCFRLNTTNTVYCFSKGRGK